MQKLTGKKEVFIKKFLECSNASESYRFAYSCNFKNPQTVRNNAHKLLREGDVKARLHTLQKEIDNLAIVKITDLITANNLIINFDVADLFNEDNTLKEIKKIPKNTRRAIGNITIVENTNDLGTTRKTTFTIDSRAKAIDSIAKMIGAYELDNLQSKTDISLKDATTEKLKEILTELKN